jgi:hypothetical protein
VDPAHGTAQQQGVGNVIAIAAIGQGQARQLAKVLLNGEQIG